MFKPNDNINKIKYFALRYVNDKYNTDYSDCEITIEDNGVFWVAIFNGDKSTAKYPQLIIKKRNKKVIQCFIHNIPKF